MAAYRAKEYIAISFVIWILCLLPFMPCATTLDGGPQDQTPNNGTTSPSQGPSIQTTGTINEGGGITAVTVPGLCDTFLERGPKNRTQIEGKKVSLICDLKDDNNRNVLWKYLSGPSDRRYISINSYIYPFQKNDENETNYKVIVNNSLQTYKLVIKPVMFPTDTGIYECGYECGSDRRYIPLASAMISVLPKNDSPLSCRMNLLSLFEGDNIFEIMCKWTQTGEALFKNASGESVEANFTFPDRIISRIESHKVPNTTCVYMSNESPSKTMEVPCIGDDRAGKVRVDPFISQVSVGSNASFYCSSRYKSHSPTWKIYHVHYDGNVSLVTSERLIQNEDVISIVNVSESDQTLIVECSLPAENMNISSYGAVRIVEITTLQTEDSTQYATDEISHSTDGISQSPNEISQSSNPKTITKTFEVAKNLNVGTSHTSGASSCQIYSLPSLELATDRDVEVMCSWTYSQVYQAQFQRSSGEAIDSYLLFPDNIITRVKSSVAKNITCRLSLDTNASMPISTPCVEDTQGLIRVDPFIDKLEVGFTTSFTCTFNDKGHKRYFSWKVHSNGNASAVNVDQREENPNVNFIVHERNDGQPMFVECHIQVSENGKNMSSYGVLHIIRVMDVTTLDITTPCGECQPSKTTDSRSDRTVEFTADQNKINETQTFVDLTTPKLPTSSGEGKTSHTTNNPSVRTLKSTTDQTIITESKLSVTLTTLKLATSSGEGQTSHTTDNQLLRTEELTTEKNIISEIPPTVSSKKGIVITVLASVAVALIILLLSIFIVYLLRKQMRISSRRYLPEDGKSNAIELSKIPHILHEESEEWYALSFKDKRVQQQQSNDLEVKHNDRDNLNGLFSSSSLGLLTLPPSESTDDHTYSETGVIRASEEPLRQTISRQQCTFTPILESNKHDE